MRCRKILDELGVSGRPVLRVLNKIDRLSPDERQTLAHEGTRYDSNGDGRRDIDGDEDRGTARKANGAFDSGAPVLVSAMTGEGLDELLRRIDQAMPVDPTVEMTLRMPLTEGRKLALIHAMGKVMRSEVDDTNMFLDAEVPESIVRRLRLADYKFAGTFPVAVS